MNFELEVRPSVSALVETVWRTRSERAGAFTSVAVSHWEIVIWRVEGKTTLTVRGPETKATPLYSPAGAEFFGIQFKLGTFLEPFAAPTLVDTAFDLPKASARAFWLNGSAWPFPDFEDADGFVARLERLGLLRFDPVVSAALRCEPTSLSSRTVRRRFLQVTGLTPKQIAQIERAQRALSLLERGAPIADVVFLAGYADQPHLTRALRRFLGRTPAQLLKAQ